MTTITREQLIEKLQNRIAVTANYPGVEEAQLDAAIFKIALASLEAKPIGAFHIADQQVDGTTDYIKNGEWPIDNGVIDVYAAPPASVTGIYDDVLNIIGLLENNEWAEHCTSTVLGSLLESEITRLVSKEQSAPVVPDDWVMVPKEPTRQMMAQGHFAMKGTDRGKFRRIYQAMITAAPALNKGGINAE